MEEFTAKLFELSKSENFNEVLLPCFDKWLKMTDGEKQEAIKEYVREGGLEELLKRSPEELKTFGEKQLMALDLSQERQRAGLVETVWRNLEEAQKKKIVLKAN